MLSSNPNRKSFSLNFNFSLSRQPSISRLLKDHDASQKSLPPEMISSPRTPVFPASLHLKQEQPMIPLPLTDGLDPSEKMKLLRKTKKLSRILGEVPIAVSINEPGSQPNTPADMHVGLPGLRREESALSSSTSPSMTASSSSMKSPLLGVARLASLRRSATVGHNQIMTIRWQGEVQRTRSLASLRTSLTIPPAAITTCPSPISPVEFSFPDMPPPVPPPDARVSPAPGNTHETAASGSATSLHRRDSVLSVSSTTTARRRDSTTSSILSPERTPEQVQRARAAKLTRQLGENLPPDVLLRASSPVPRLFAPTPSLVSFLDASMGPQDRHGAVRRSTSTKRVSPRDRASPAKRPRSLDVRTSAGRVPDKEAEAKQRVLLRKSRSTSEKMRSMTASAVEMSPSRKPRLGPDADSDLDDDDLSRPLTIEKQRALNARRARKMAQMFGNDPPPALFQITNCPPTNVSNSSLSDALNLAARVRCDSRATFISVTLSQGLHTPNVDDHEKRQSQGSSTGNLSPLVFANPASGLSSTSMSPYPDDVTGDAESELLPYLKPDHECGTDLRPTSPFSLPSLINPLTCPSQGSVVSSSSIPAQSPPTSQQSQTPLTSQSSLPSPIRGVFRAVSPPPFVTMFQWGSSSRSVSAPASPPTSQFPPPSPISPGFASPLSASEVSPSDPMFRMRRLRAAKLSRFFGVGMNDITGMLVTNEPAPCGQDAPIDDRDSVHAAAPSARSSSSHSLPLSRTTSRSHSQQNHDEIPPVPPIPPLEVFRNESVETFSSPSSPRSSRWFSNSAHGHSEPESEEPLRHSRKSSCPRRSQSASRTRKTRQPQPQPSQSQTRQPSGSSSTGGHLPAFDRNRSNSEPEAKVVAPPPPAPPVARPQIHERACSTTVEIAAEYRGPKYFFRESRQLGKTKELEMHAAIKQLRKIR